MSLASFSLNTNTLELVEERHIKKEKNVSAKIARNFISKIESNYNFKAVQVKKIVFALALAVSAVSESKICLKCMKRSLMGDKENNPEKIIVKKFINNLTLRENFSEEEVKKIMAELYNSMDYAKIIHSFELIQYMRTFVRSHATN